jgi:hypothetical protein
VNSLSLCSRNGMRSRGRTSILLVSVLLALLLSVGFAAAWPVTDLKITPENPCVNDGNITITGKVGPGDYVTISTTYVKEVSVSNGKYEYDAGKVPIPAGTTVCSVTAEGVKDLTISTSILGIPLSKSQDASAGKAAMSASHVPKGNYSLVLSGEAAGTDPVKITFVAKMDVKADKNGYFKQVCCTNRPAGEYTLKVGDKTKVITLSDCNDREKDATDGVSDGGDTTTDNTIAHSGGTGEAKVVSPEGESSSVGNASVMQTTPETSSEDVTEQPASPAETNTFMDFIRSVLNWLGF